MEDIRQNIELNYSSNAEATAKDVEVLANSVDNVTDSQDKNSKSTKKNEESLTSFKTQLRQANQELLKASQIYGETSKEAVQAAKKVADLKDQMNFAKDLVDKFNPDQKMKALTAATSLAGTAMTGVTSGMALFGDQSEDTQKQLLKVQAAMAFGQAISGLSEVGDQFKVLKTTAIDAFKGIKNAIGSTGIGLLVIALGVLYTYWDDIKEAVSGVSAEQKKLNAESQKNVEQENEKLKTIGAQDNILKLQGKTEKEILAIKVRQTDEAIQATEINQKNQIQTNKLAVIGAKRNYEMLRSYIDFMQTPLRWLYKTGAEAINGIIDLLNKVPGVNIKGKLDETLGEKAADYLAKLGFDPEKVKAEGDKTVKESADALTKLKNDRAGYQLAINSIDQKGADDRKKADDERRKKEEEQAKKDLEDLNKSLQKQRDAELQSKLDSQNAIDKATEENIARGLTEREKEERDVKDKYFSLIELAKQNGEDTNQLEIAKLNELNDINLKYQQIDYDNKKKKADDEIAIEKAKQEQKKAIQDAEFQLAEQGLSAAKDIFGKNKNIQKGIIIAESGVALGKLAVNTVEQVSKDNTASPLTFGMPWSGVHIAQGVIGATSIVSNTNKALQALGGGSAPSSSSGVSGGQTSSAPQMSFQTSKENQIATSLSGKINEQPPIKAYVTTGDVTTGLLLHNKTIEENKI